MCAQSCLGWIAECPREYSREWFPVGGEELLNRQHYQMVLRTQSTPGRCITYCSRSSSAHALAARRPRCQQVEGRGRRRQRCQRPKTRSRARTPSTRPLSDSAIPGHLASPLHHRRAKKISQNVHKIQAHPETILAIPEIMTTRVLPPCTLINTSDRRRGREGLDL